MEIANFKKQVILMRCINSKQQFRYLVCYGLQVKTLYDFESGPPPPGPRPPTYIYVYIYVREFLAHPNLRR